MGAFLRKLFERYARRLIIGTGEGIKQIPNKDRVKRMADNIYKDLKVAGVTDDMIKTENDIRNLHHQVAEMNNQQIARKFKDLMDESTFFNPKKKGEVIAVDFDKNKNWFKGKSEGVTDVSFKSGVDSSGKRVLMSNDDYRTLKEEWFSRIIANTDNDLNTWLKKGINASDDRLKNLTRNQRVDFMNMVQDRIQLGNKKFMDIYTDAKGVFNKFPEDFAQGGRTGSGLNYLLGEDDQNTRVPYASGSRKESWTDKLTRWGGGPSMIAGDLGFEGLHQIYQLLGMGGLYAEGGRTGFGLGGGFNAARRAFLKIMGGTAAGVGVAKSGLFSLLKGGASKSVIAPATHAANQIVQIQGMPYWFKPLVNKVIKEGNQIESGAERVIVHKSKLPNSKTDLYVTQELDTGNVMVDVGIGKHGFADGHLGQPVRLEYKASEVIEPDMGRNYQIKDASKPTKGPLKTKEEFNVEEAEFTGGHPENIKFEETTISEFGEHGSDFSEVEKFATGKTTKASKKGSKQVWEADWDDSLPDYEDFASGGRVPLAEGTTPSTEQLQQYYEDLEKQKERERLQREIYKQRFGGPGPILEAATGGRVPLAGGGIMKLLKLLQKKFPGTTKLGQTSRPMAPKTELKQAIAGFQEREAAVKLKEMIKNKYQGRIDDKLLQQMLTDNNPQRLAEVMATVDEALLMQGKGMGPDQIIQVTKDSWKRKKNASGGIAGMLGE